MENVITLTYEQLGAAGAAVSVLVWFIAVLLRHISYLTRKLDEHIVYERETLVSTLLEVSGSHKDLVVSFDALRDVLR